jgi:hypothetical protein
MEFSNNTVFWSRNIEKYKRIKLKIIYKLIRIIGRKREKHNWIDGLFFKRKRAKRNIDKWVILI